MEIDRLTQISIQDMVESFGLGRVRRGRALLSMLCYWPARRFAATVAEFDRRVGEDGVRAAAKWAIERFSARLAVTGDEHLPGSAPVLVVSNHPGITDTLALLACIPRDDLLTIAAARPFLLELEQVSRRLVYVAEHEPTPIGVVRSVAAHLRRYGAVLTFPAGRIEPDPARLPGAIESLETWSPSLDLFVRLAPDATIVPVVVSGVFSPRALSSPLIRLRRTPAGRERAAAMLQVVAPARYPVTVRVTFGRPICAREWKRGECASLRVGVIEEMARLMRAIPSD